MHSERGELYDTVHLFFVRYRFYLPLGVIFFVIMPLEDNLDGWNKLYK